MKLNNENYNELKEKAIKMLNESEDKPTALALYTVNCEFIYNFEFYLIFKF